MSKGISFDFFKTINDTFAGIILFLGNYFYTTYRLMVAPTATAKELIGEEEHSMTLPFNYMIGAYILFNSLLKFLVPTFWIFLYGMLMGDVAEFQEVVVKITDVQLKNSPISLSLGNILLSALPFSIVLSGISYFLATVFGVPKNKRLNVIYLACYACGYTFFVCILIFSVLFGLEQLGIYEPNSFLLPMLIFSISSLYFIWMGSRILMPAFAQADGRAFNLKKQLLAILFYLAAFVLPSWALWEITLLQFNTELSDQQDDGDHFFMKHAQLKIDSTAAIQFSVVLQNTSENPIILEQGYLTLSIESIGYSDSTMQRIDGMQNPPSFDQLFIDMSFQMGNDPYKMVLSGRLTPLTFMGEMDSTARAFFYQYWENHAKDNHLFLEGQLYLDQYWTFSQSNQIAWDGRLFLDH